MPFDLTEEASVSTLDHSQTGVSSNESPQNSNVSYDHELQSEHSTDEDSSCLESSSGNESDSAYDQGEEIYTDDISGIFPLADLPEPGQMRDWARYAAENPLERDDLLLIGANMLDKMLECTTCVCSTRKFRSRLGSHQGSETLHQLETRSLNVYKDSTSLGASVWYKIFSFKGDRVFKSDYRYLKDVLVEMWEDEADIRHPRSLQSRWGVLVSLCTRNAIKCSILDLLWTPSIQRLLQLYRNSPAGQSIVYWDSLWNSGPEKLIEMWDKCPQRQETLGRIILLCLKQLRRTGYDAQRALFNVLWVQKSSGDLERVALKPCSHSWVHTLRDSTVSCSMAVLVEESFCIRDGDNYFQNCGDSKIGQFPSRLETAIQVTTSLPPFAGCQLQAKGRNHISPVQLALKFFPDDHVKYTVNASLLKAGEHIWMTSPQHRLSIVSILSSSHLLLKWDASLVDAAKHAFFSSHDRQGHLEFVNESNLDEVDPIIVHIQSTAMWGTKEKIAIRQLK